MYIQLGWTPIEPIIKDIRIDKNQSHIPFSIQLTITIIIHWSQGLSLVELAFDHTNIKKHGLWYKVFSCILTKERLYLLIQFQCDNFHIDQCIIKQMKRLKTFANRTPFVPWLNFFYHSHVIIQALNTNSLEQHYQDIDHNHNLQVSCILCILTNKNTIVKWYTKIHIHQNILIS
jgi:hypothetical protein